MKLWRASRCTGDRFGLLAAKMGELTQGLIDGLVAESKTAMVSEGEVAGLSRLREY